MITHLKFLKALTAAGHKFFQKKKTFASLCRKKRYIEIGAGLYMVDQTGIK